MNALVQAARLGVACVTMALLFFFFLAPAFLLLATWAAVNALWAIARQDKMIRDSFDGRNHWTKLSVATLLTLATALFLALNLHAQFVSGTLVSGTLNLTGSASTSSSISYLTQQDFEGTGYDHGETWVENAAVNPDYTTAPAPLVGSQSWQTAAIGGEAHHAHAGTSDIWGYCQSNIQVIDDNRQIWNFRDSGGTALTAVKIHSDGSFDLSNFATTVSTSAGAFTAGTTFHMWIHYIKGSGANSTSELYISANATKPGSPNAIMTNAGSTADCAQDAIMGWNGGNYIFDKVRSSASNIGSNPL